MKDVEQFINDKINDTNTVPSNVQQIRNHHRVDHNQNQSNYQDQNSPLTYNRNFPNQNLNKQNDYYDSDQRQNLDNMISKEDEEVISVVKKVFQEINETLDAMVFDKSMKRIIKIPISEIIKKISDLKEGNLLILDGIITPRLVESANKSGINTSLVIEPTI